MQSKLGADFSVDFGPSVLCSTCSARVFSTSFDPIQYAPDSGWLLAVTVRESWNKQLERHKIDLSFSFERTGLPPAIHTAE